MISSLWMGGSSLSVLTASSHHCPVHVQNHKCDHYFLKLSDRIYTERVVLYKNCKSIILGVVNYKQVSMHKKPKKKEKRKKGSVSEFSDIGISTHKYFTFP